MALLTILHFPDPRLRQVAKPIQKIDPSIQTIIDDMFETMYQAPGIGLAATQVGIAKRLAVMDISPEKNSPLVLINPQIIETSDLEILEEGCLSVPGHTDKINRATRLKMQALDRHGKAFMLDAEGLLAHCIQHEVDHLNGKLYIDYLSALKRQRIRDKLLKLKRENS